MNNNESLMKQRGEQKVLKDITTKSGKSKDVSSTQLGQQMLFEDAIRIEPIVTEWINKGSARVYRTKLKDYFVDDQIILQKITETLLHLAGSIYYGDSPNSGSPSKSRHKKVNSLRAKIMPELSFELTWRFIEIVVESSVYFEVNRSSDKTKGRAGLSLTYVCNIGPEILEAIAKKSGRAFYPMPTDVPPVMWSIDENGKAIGGYEGHQLKLVRANDKLVDYSKFSQDIFDSINYIQSTPWKVNKELLEVVRADLRAPLKEDFIKTEYPDSDRCAFEIDIKDENCTLPKEDLDLIHKEREAYKHKLSLYRAEAGDYETAVGKYRALKLAIHVADQYEDKEEIYFPHSYDFRGRIYPLPIGLTPQGSDAVKSLLLYRDTQKLTERGMVWNWAYLASLYGDDKLDLLERAERGKELLTANYKDADESYQFLSHQLEMQKHMLDEDYIPNTRIHLDACNSGSQFTSAITGDLDGCIATNVIPTFEDGKIVRKDAYLLVANKALELSNRMIEKEEDHKSRETLKFLRDLLINHGRKICKVPVMVSNYGGTTGGRTDILWDMFRELNVERKWIKRSTAALFAKIIGDSIVGVLNGGKAFELYIHKMNNAVAKNNQPIEWTTGDGFNVVHVKYKELAPKQITCTLPKARKTTCIFNKSFSDKVSAQKMKSAISPNYIHSLDAELLRRVALRMHQKNIVFTDWIHDSFGCHPNDVDFMLKATKEEFNLLVSKDPLRKLDQELRSQAMDTKSVIKALESVEIPVLKTIVPGEFDPHNSDWFFS